jgi:uncharacterized membrane protein SpoIIM required for sporulation
MSSFIKERQNYLMRLEYLLGRARTRYGLRRFTRDELYELGRLYRQLASDLAKAQTINADRDILDYLNGLLAQAYNVIYTGENQPGPGLVRFITQIFPRAFRRNFAPILIATAVFFLPAIWAFFAYLNDPAWTEVVLPKTVREAYESDLEKGPSQLAVAIQEADMPVASTYIILNNVTVSAYAFAAGMLFGVGTLFILFQNGLILGAIGGIFVDKGTLFSLYFFSGILPHGVLELPAICIAGGAGLLFGKALLMPGDLKRIDALKKNGIEALNLMLGVIFILIFAGLFEGFITPIKIDGKADIPSLMYAKLAFSAIAFLCLVTYLSLAGRKPGEKPFDFINEEIARAGKYSPRGIFRLLKSDSQEF